MADQAILLSDLLDDTRREVDAVARAATDGDPAQALLDKGLAFVDGAVDEHLRAACQQDIVGLLVEGWSKAVELGGYADPVKYPATRTVTMVLAKHPVKAVIDPQLTLRVAGLADHRLALLIELVMTINAATLIITGGAIVEARLGTVTLAAKLRWAKAELPLRLKQVVVTLPGVRRFDPGIAIRR